MKKIVDERQELELLKIERAGFYVLFLPYGLIFPRLRHYFSRYL